MPKKTIGLLASLIVITAVLLIAALNSKSTAPVNSPDQTDKTVQQPTKANVAHSVLSLSPNPAYLDSANKGSIDVMINTDTNEVTAVQLELQYDPKAITNVQVQVGDFFSDPISLINTNDKTSGRITYALGISPAQQPVKGEGVVAKVTFTKVASSTLAETELALLPSSLVTSSGIDDSVLKSATGANILLK